MTSKIKNGTQSFLTYYGGYKLPTHKPNTIINGGLLSDMSLVF